jgi:ribokinase
MPPPNVAPAQNRYGALIGVGGIGTGTVFALSGNHTLGREESRSGQFLDARDYCKLHIVAHYVQTLARPPFVTLPIGKVGRDAVGERLLSEMQAAGLDLRYVQVCPDLPTLNAICLVYPDGSGGNLTTEQSACAFVDAQQVAQAEPAFSQHAGRAIALALPEVPLEPRATLLDLGTANQFFRVGSFTSAEMVPAMEAGLVRKLDLLAINLDEAAAVLGRHPEDASPSQLVGMVVESLHAGYPDLGLSITAGKNGSWSWNGKSLVHVASLAVDVASTAGAGDAHLAGIIVGLVQGLPLVVAHELGTLVAAMSVTSLDAIHPAITRPSLREFAARHQARLSDAVQRFLAEA